MYNPDRDLPDCYYADAPGVPREKLVKLTDYEALQSRLDAAVADKDEAIARMLRTERRLDRARLLAHSWADTPLTTMDRSTMQTLSAEMLRVLGEKWIAESNPGVVDRQSPISEEDMIAGRHAYLMGDERCRSTPRYKPLGAEDVRCEREAHHPGTHRGNNLEWSE